jgi:hypothetical protein
LLTDSALTVVDPLGKLLADPWHIVVNTASAGIDGLERGLKWLRVMAQSGVDIPQTTFAQVSAFARDFNASFEVSQILVETILASVWVKSLGKQELLGIIAALHLRFVDSIEAKFEMDDNTASR